MSTAYPTLKLSASERADLLRDPEAFARRAEQVLTTVVHKLKATEATQVRERIDWERKFHKLDRGQSTLVEEHKKAVADSRKMAAERSVVNEAKDASTADVARLTSELRSAKAEVARLKEGEREGAEGAEPRGGEDGPAAGLLPVQVQARARVQARVQARARVRVRVQQVQVQVKK